MLKRKLDISKNDGFGPFWAQFTPGKPKVLTNTTFFQKLHFYNYQTAQVPGPT